METDQKCYKFAWHREWIRSKNVTNLKIVKNLSTMLVLDIKGVENGDGPKMLQV